MSDDLPSVSPVTQLPFAEGASQLVDTRGAARGWGRVVMAAFWLAGAALVIVALFQIFQDSVAPLGPRLVTLFAGMIYVGAALGLTHNGRKMRRLAWVCISMALAGPIVVGLFNLGVTRVYEGWSPWMQFGAEAGYLPLLLPLVGYVWLWWSNPRRIVEIAEGIERPSRRSSGEGEPH